MENKEITLRGLLRHIEKALAVHLDDSSPYEFGGVLPTPGPESDSDYSSILLGFDYRKVPLVAMTLLYESPEYIDEQLTFRLPELRISFGKYSPGAFSGAETAVILADANQLLSVVDEAAKDYCRN